MKADLAKLRALHEAAFQLPIKNLDAFADAMHEALPELLAIAEAVERDALRYRWLRDRSNAAPENTPTVYDRQWYRSSEPFNTGRVIDGEELDAAIDRLLAIGEDG